MKQKSHIIFVCIILSAVIMVCAAAMDGYGKTHTNLLQRSKSEVEVAETKQLSEDTREFRILRDAYADRGNTLVFYSTNQYLEVYMDDVLLYQLVQGDEHFGHTPGSLWNFVSIPEGTQEIRIVVQGAYQALYDREEVFYVGTGAAVYRQLMKDSVRDGEMSLISMLLGLAMIFFWLFSKKRIGQGRTLLYLGLFSIVIGMWSYGETDMAALLQPNHQASTFLAFILIMLMPIAFILFMKEFFGIAQRKGWQVIFGISVVNFILCSLLELFSIRDFKETILVTHILIVIEMFYMFYTLTCRIRRDGMTRFIKVNIVGVIILLGSCLGDFHNYYVGNINTDSVGRIGFFIYIVMLGMEAAGESLKQIEEGSRALFYKELAITDGLTGVWNRNAFNQFMEETTSGDDIAVVAFDLNELKRCNDEHGHAAGDEYITRAADIIMRAFVPYGKCYRIGGDEFVAIVERQSQCGVQKMIRKMEEREAEYNRSANGIYMEIAWGTAVYDASLDEDLRATLARADLAMYENKRLMKETAI